MGAAEIDPGERRVRCRTSSLVEALGMVVHGLDGALPLVLVVGETGTGKSALLQSVAERLGTRARVVLVSGAAATFETIVVRCLASLGVPVMDEPPILQIRRLADRLLAARSEGRRLILLIDDADRLESQTLQELRLLLTPNAVGKALLPLALAGPPALRTRLAEPPLSSLGAGVLLEVALEAPAAVELVAEALPAVLAPQPPDDRDDDADDADGLAALVPALLPAVLDVPFGRPRPRRPWAIATATTMLCASLAFVGLEEVPRWVESVASAKQAVPSPLPVTAAPAAAPAPGTPAVPAPRPNSALAPRDGPLSADEARRAVNAFREAVALGDVDRLRRLLAPDAEQQELHGREKVLAAYAYRFQHVDHETDILAPEQVALRDGDAIVTAPFVDWYRDAAGRPGTLGGTARWRIVRRGGQPTVASIDYEYALADEE